MRLQSLLSVRGWAPLLSAVLLCSVLGAQGLADLSGPQRGLGAGDLERAAFDAIRQDKLVRARELGDQILDQDSSSYLGHCVLGVAQHRGEGNLAIALYHLKRCRELFETRFGTMPGDEEPWFWHGLVLDELAMVSGEMGRHQDKIDYLEQREILYQPSYPAEKGWPLMRLRRYPEARLAAAEGLLMMDRPGQVSTAKTALCAIEAELHDREASYRACLEAMEFDRQTRSGGPAVYTNAAEAALSMLEMDEAERYILEGTRRFVTGSVANPWMDLALLYISQGRASEALDALRRMRRWRNSQPPYMGEQNKAETEMTAAVFLIVAGMGPEATKITARAMDRPDRTGFTSSESEQMEAAAALLDSLAQRLAAALAAEEASWSSPLDALKARLQMAGFSFRAWSSGRKAASLLAHERILEATLRPYLAGSVEVPHWVEPDLCALLGAGLVEAALTRARSKETLAAAEGYFTAFESEIARLRSQHRDALAAAERALEILPGSEVLLRARVAAVGADAARRLRATSRSLELFDLALQLDPGTLRRLDLALPVRFQWNGGELAKRAAKLLRRSPRFRATEGGFPLRVEDSGESANACLFGINDERLVCVEVSPRAGEDIVDRARRLAAELHRRAFAPKVDLTQSDLQSLDGSPTAGGGRSAERMRDILDDLVQD